MRDFLKLRLRNIVVAGNEEPKSACRPATKRKIGQHPCCSLQLLLVGQLGRRPLQAPFSFRLHGYRQSTGGNF